MSSDKKLAKLYSDSGWEYKREPTPALTRRGFSSLLTDLMWAFPEQEMKRLTKIFTDGLPHNMRIPKRSIKTRHRIEVPLKIISGRTVSKRTSMFEDLFLIIFSQSQKSKRNTLGWYYLLGR